MMCILMMCVQRRRSVFKRHCFVTEQSSLTTFRCVLDTTGIFHLDIAYLNNTRENVDSSRIVYTEAERKNWPINVIALNLNTVILCENVTKIKCISVKVDTRHQKHHHCMWGPDAAELNQHYANISTDPRYKTPRVKATVSHANLEFSEYSVFNILDKLKPTATGIDGLPVWFIRMASSWIAGPVSHIFNLSYRTSVVSVQWKRSCITTVP